jgi:hypothetical protein
MVARRLRDEAQKAGTKAKYRERETMAAVNAEGRR